MTQKTTDKTIILIHGFRGTHHGLELIAKNIARYAKGGTMIIPDLPGFADGEVLATHDLDSYVEWLKEFIAAQQLQTPPVLLGHSFGSIVSAAYAAKYPKTIEKLVLVNPIGAPALEGPRGILSKLAVFYYWLGTKLPEKSAQKWLASKTVVNIMTNTMTKTNDKELKAFIKDQHLQYFSRFHTAKSVAEGFSTSISNSVRDVATKITVPTLLIVGEKDDITPLDKQKELHKLFQNAKLEVIHGVGHLTHYETPDQVGSLVAGFIILP